MKKTILISILLFSCTVFYGQGTSYNLGFSQVLNLEFDIQNATGYIWNSAGTITVPSNKVYKITSGSSYLYYSSSINNDTEKVKFKVGEHIVVDNNYNANGWVKVNHCPIWLSSGTYNVYLYSNTSGSISFSLKGALSIVEFNVE